MNRQEEIKKILSELEQLKLRVKDADFLYAVNANIDFYKSLKSIRKYIFWLIKVAPHLDPKKLLEINDLLPQYDSEMHEQLMVVERKKFPGLIKGIVNALTEFIVSSNKDLVLLSIGSGSMELERQVITELVKREFKNNLIFIADDKSPLAHKIARENLNSLSAKITFYSTENITTDFLMGVKKKTNANNYTIVQCQNNIFALDKTFSENYFDVVYNSLFKHHLNSEQTRNIERICLYIGKNYFEYDGYHSFFQLIPQSLTAWHSPVLLNGAILSGLRYCSKNEVLKNVELISSQGVRCDTRFFKTSHYLLKCSKV